MTTAGDLIVGNAANDVKRLAIGSEGQVLEMAAGAVAWATVAEQAFADDDTTLTNLNDPGASYVQWGTEEAVVADPSAQVTVLGFLCGQITFSNVLSGTRTGYVKVEYSLDGGGTWTALEDHAVSQYVGTMGVPTHLLAPIVYARQVTPTGDIQLRASGMDGGSCDVAFSAGHIVGLVLRDA